MVGDIGKQYQRGKSTTEARRLATSMQPEICWFQNTTLATIRMQPKRGVLKPRFRPAQVARDTLSVSAERRRLSPDYDEELRCLPRRLDQGNS